MSVKGYDTNVQLTQTKINVLKADTNWHSLADMMDRWPIRRKGVQTVRQNKKKSIFYSVSALLLVLILSTGIACAPAVPEPAPDSTQYEEYRSLAMSILSGEKLDRLSFDPAGDQLYFGFEGDHFCSYTDAKFDDDDYERGYFSDSDPVETYPRSLGEEAQRAIARERNAAFPDYGLDPGFKARMYGYAGEGWVVLSNGDDLMHDEAVTCVFLRGLDGSWHEIGNNNSVFPRALTGACMLSDREGYLCFGDRYFDPDGGAARKLHIFHTNDGGENWADVGLELPEEYGEPNTLIPCSPVFDGEHGVILVTAYFNDRDELRGWFETTDGGANWTFVDPLM